MGNKFDSSIEIGNNNIIKNSSIGNGTPNKKEKISSKVLWLIIVPIITAVVAGLILFFLRIN